MFTKGEWEISKPYEQIPYTVSSSEKYPIARLGFHGEDEANARLISSAPDLYEAALLARSLVNTKLFFHPDDKLAQWEKEVIDKAIAKAEGKDAEK